MITPPIQIPSATDLIKPPRDTIPSASALLELPQDSIPDASGLLEPSPWRRVLDRINFLRLVGDASRGKPEAISALSQAMAKSPPLTRRFLQFGKSMGNVGLALAKYFDPRIGILNPDFHTVEGIKNITGSVSSIAKVPVGDLFAGFAEGIAGIPAAPLEATLGVQVKAGELTPLTEEEAGQRILETTANVVGLASGVGVNVALERAFTRSAAQKLAATTLPHEAVQVAKEVVGGKLKRAVAKGVAEGAIGGFTGGLIMGAGDEEMAQQALIFGVLFGSVGAAFEIARLPKGKPDKLGATIAEKASELAYIRMLKATKSDDLIQIFKKLDGLETADEILDAVLSSRLDGPRSFIVPGVTPDRVSKIEQAAKFAAPPHVARGLELVPEVVDQVVLHSRKINDITAMDRQLGPQRGTNPGGIWLGKDGVTRYIKLYPDPGQSISEVVANVLYRDLGLEAPNSNLLIDQGNNIIGVASDWLDNKGTIGITLDEEAAYHILNGFVADVLAANWDAVGTGTDNVVRTATGVARVDQGGTFKFRAQGALKDPAVLFEIDEWNTFITRNPYYKQVFDKVGIKSADELGEWVVAQIDNVLSLRDGHGGWSTWINDAIGWAGDPIIDQAKVDIAQILSKRTKGLEKKRSQILDALDQARTGTGVELYPRKDGLFDVAIIKSGGIRAARTFKQTGFVPGELVSYKGLDFEISSAESLDNVRIRRVGSTQTIRVPFVKIRRNPLQQQLVFHGSAFVFDAHDPSRFVYRNEGIGVFVTNKAELASEYYAMKGGDHAAGLFHQFEHWENRELELRQRYADAVANNEPVTVQKHLNDMLVDAQVKLDDARKKLEAFKSKGVFAPNVRLETITTTDILDTTTDIRDERIYRRIRAQLNKERMAPNRIDKLMSQTPARLHDAIQGYFHYNQAEVRDFYMRAKIKGIKREHEPQAHGDEFEWVIFDPKDVRRGVPQIDQPYGVLPENVTRFIYNDFKSFQEATRKPADFSALVQQHTDLVSQRANLQTQLDHTTDTSQRVELERQIDALNKQIYDIRIQIIPDEIRIRLYDLAIDIDEQTSWLDTNRGTATPERITEVETIVEGLEKEYEAAERQLVLAEGGDTRSFNEVFEAFATSRGFKRGELPALEDIITKEFEKEIIESDPELVEVFKTRDVSFASIVEAEQKAAIREQQQLISEALTNGFFIDSEDAGRLTLRDEQGRRITTVDTVQEALEFIDKSGQAVANGSGGFGGLPPKWPGVQLTPEGMPPFNEAKWIVDRNKILEIILDHVSLATDPWFSQPLRAMQVIDKTYGTRFYELVGDRGRTLRARMDAALKPTKERLAGIVRPIEKLTRDRREVIGGYIETQNTVKDATPIELKAAQDIVAVGVDLTNVLRYLQKLNKIATKVTDQNQLAVIVQKLQAQMGLSKNDLKIAGLLQGINGRVGVIAKLSRELSRSGDYVKKHNMTALEIKAAKELDAFNKSLGPEHDLLRDIATYARLYTNGDMTVALEAFNIPTQQKALMERLVRVWDDIDAYEKDPFMASLRVIRAKGKLDFLETYINDAHKYIRSTLSKTGDHRDSVKGLMNRFMGDIQGFHTEHRKANMQIIRNINNRLGLRLNEDLMHDITTLVLQTGEAAFQGGRILYAGLRDYLQPFGLHYATFGRRAAAEAMELGIKGYDNITAQDLIRAGELADYDLTTITAADEYTNSLIGRSFNTFTRRLSAMNRAAFRLSGQGVAYRRAAAGIYLERYKNVAAQLLELSKNNITKDKAYEKIKLWSYEPPVQEAFDRMVKARKYEDATRFLARATVAENIGYFSQGNRMRWQRSELGRLAGQFGSWAMFARAHLQQRLTRGTMSQRAGYAARFLTFQAAFVAAGAALGLNLGSWLVPPGLAFAGGPTVEAAKTVYDAIFGYGVERELAQRELMDVFPVDPITGEFQLPDIWYPGKIVINDLVEAYQMYLDGDPRAAARAFGYRPRQD